MSYEPKKAFVGLVMVSRRLEEFCKFLRFVSMASNSFQFSNLFRFDTAPIFHVFSLLGSDHDFFGLLKATKPWDAGGG